MDKLWIVPRNIRKISMVCLASLCHFVRIGKSAEKKSGVDSKIFLPNSTDGGTLGL